MRVKSYIAMENTVNLKPNERKTGHRWASTDCPHHFEKKGEFSVRAIFLNFLTFQRRIAEWSKALTTFTIAQMAMDRFPSMSHFLGGHFLTFFALVWAFLIATEAIWCWPRRPLEAVFKKFQVWDNMTQFTKFCW